MCQTVALIVSDSCASQYIVCFFSLQAESVENVAIADASARYPFFALKEHKEPASDKADVEEGAATECRGDRNFNERRLRLVASLGD